MTVAQVQRNLNAVGLRSKLHAEFHVLWMQIINLKLPFRRLTHGGVLRNGVCHCYRQVGVAQTDVVQSPEFIAQVYAVGTHRQ